MPALSVKELYLATSIEKLDKELMSIADVSKRPTANLCKSAQKLYKSAEECYLMKDEEKAYVQFSKYVYLILTIKKRSDFGEDKSSKLLSENAKTAMTRAECLKDSLLKRYSILREIEFRENNEKNGEIHSIPKKVITEESDVESATGINVAKENGSDKVQAVEETVSSERLYSLFQNPHLHSSIILMDVRSERDFEESHIKHSFCISIPREILRAGITAAALEQLLPVDSLSKWQNRGNAEYIVLIDSDFKDNLFPGSHLHTLKQAMCKWDQNCSLKKPPMILQGGYKDWMLRYPMHTTKALGFPSFSSIASVTPITDVSGVEYPNLDDNSAEKKEEITNIPDPLFKKSKPPENNVNNVLPNSDQDASRNNQIKSAPTFNRKAKPGNITDRGLSADTATNRTIHNDINNRTPGLFARITNPIHKNNPSSSGTNEAFKPFPNVDRKLKPSKNEEALMTALSKEENLAKESLDIAKEQLVKENEFEKLRMRKALEAEESKRMEIQKQEDSLRERMKQLEENAHLKDLELNKVKEENAKMKKFLDEHMDKELQKQKEKEILDAENKKKILQEDVERLRELRKKQEKNTQKKIEILKPDINHREVASANSALKRNTYHEPELTKHSNSTEYTISLSKQTSYDGSSKGLVRSHSSPNIAEMVNQEEIIPRKLPSVDRSLKPKPTSPIQHSEINRARLRNLNPVYGNSLVRPATGIRNLGNTCFMNSIIQCLSNTIPLAYYFTSREYTRDINRENKQGTGGELAEEFAVIIQALWMGQYKSFSPKDFKNTVSRCLSVCIGNEQQDSHEFLVVLMEKLHADLNKRCERIPLPKLDDKPEHVAKEMFWRHHKTVNNSKISEVFDGLLKSTLTCMVCQKTSNNFEVFSCLSLPILSYKCSLRDCLQHFLKPEKMSGEAAWDCPRCKQKKDAEKRLFISRLPDILIIQLKRFSYDGMWRRKLQTHVDFDTAFEMPYEDSNEIRSRSYTLYGIVNHYGTLEGGHYTAYCRNSTGRKWYKYDDHEVSEISSSDIKTSAAYLLFYNAIDYS